MATAPPRPPLAPAAPAPTEIASWDARRRQTNLNYKQGFANLAHKRQGLNLGYGDARRDLALRFNLARKQMPYQANARGLLRSGIYKQGLQDYAQDRQRQIGMLLRQRQHQMGGLSLDRQQLEQTRAGLLGDIAAQEAARRQQLAAQIKGMG